MEFPHTQRLVLANITAGDILPMATGSRQNRFPAFCVF